MASSPGAGDMLSSGNDDASSSTLAVATVKLEDAEVGDGVPGEIAALLAADVGDGVSGEIAAPLPADLGDVADAPKSGEVAPPVDDRTAEVRYPAMPTDRPVCSKCNTQLDELRVQITGKKAGVWRCSTCCTRATQLHRVFGTTSPNGLKDLTADEQADFWKQIGMTKGDKAALQKCVAERITTRKTEQDKAEAGGRYLPLSVYAKMGYDIKKIEDGCTDTEEHALFGTCYRVSINGGWKSTLDERTRDKTYTGSSGSKKRARSASASSDDKVRRSARGTDKGKTKAVLAKEAAKEAEKDKAKEKAMQAKELGLNKKLAGKVLTKVAAVRYGLGETCKARGLANLPSFAAEALTGSKEILDSIDKAAKSSLKSGAPLEWSLAEIDCYIADAKSHDSIVNQLLAAAKVMCKKEK
jgi:hypothetical protein